MSALFRIVVRGERSIMAVSITMTTTFFAAIAFIVIGLLLTLMILITKKKLVGNSKCTITVNQDDSLVKDVKIGSTLLNTLLSNDIQIPSPCGGKATCKQCKVQILKGSGPLLETDKATFSPKELQEGWRLSCQCKVKNNLELKIPEALLDVKEFKGRVLSNKNVATFIKELVIELDHPLEYRAGAYLQFRVPAYQTNTSDWKSSIDPIFYPDWEKYQMFDREIRYEPDQSCLRAYSMASHPSEKDGRVLKFNIRIATPPLNPKKKKLTSKPWGVCSAYLFSLKPNDTVSLSGPFGESFMIDDERPLYFLIGGAGSSFARAHILHLFEKEKTKRNVTLWYGARSLKENIYQEDFEKLAKDFSNFSYHLVLSDPLEEDFHKGWPKEDPLKTGFVFKAFEEGDLKKMEEPDEALYYVCGPPLHNKAVMELLDNYGVPRKNIVLDDFGN